MKYFIAITITFIVWIFLFLRLPKHRKEMIITSCLITPFILIDVLTVPVYWKPETIGNIPIGIEGVLFTFFISGIASICAKLLLKKTTVKKATLKLKNVLLYMPGFFLAIILLFYSSINPMIIILLFLTTANILMLLKRRDLAANFFISSLFFTFLYIGAYILWLSLCPSCKNWWNSTGSIGYLGYIPIGEIIFSLTFGGLAGILYEYLFENTH